MEWARPRPAHGLASQYVYVCARHQCCRCSASIAGAKKRVRKLRFLADHADAMAQVPACMKHYWHFSHAGTTGQKMCEASVVDFIRAMATRTSWNAIADVINEMKDAAWARQVAKPYVGHARYNYHNTCYGRIFITPQLLSARIYAGARQRAKDGAKAAIICICPCGAMCAARGVRARYATYAQALHHTSPVGA